MFLDLSNNHLDYDKDVWPFLKNGIIIDTSVFKIIVDGLVDVRISKKQSSELDTLLLFFDILKFKDKWNKFFITPHILTEVCAHLRNDHSKNHKYNEIVGEVIPIIKEMDEKIVYKEEILKLIDENNPVVELGDISIFVIADEFASRDEKIAILVKDRGINRRYENSQKVMLLDYVNIMNNMM